MASRRAVPRLCLALVVMLLASCAPVTMPPADGVTTVPAPSVQTATDSLTVFVPAATRAIVEEWLAANPAASRVRLVSEIHAGEMPDLFASTIVGPPQANAPDGEAATYSFLVSPDIPSTAQGEAQALAADLNRSVTPRFPDAQADFVIPDWQVEDMIEYGSGPTAFFCCFLTSQGYICLPTCSETPPLDLVTPMGVNEQSLEEALGALPVPPLVVVHTTADEGLAPDLYLLPRRAVDDLPAEALASGAVKVGAGDYALVANDTGDPVAYDYARTVVAAANLDALVLEPGAALTATLPVTGTWTITLPAAAEGAPSLPMCCLITPQGIVCHHRC